LSFTLAIVFSLNARGADAWFAGDKVKHFFLAGFAQSSAYSVLRATGVDHGSSLVGATIASSATSVAKELSDRPTTGFSVKDLVWDAGGIGASTALIARIQR
jgi:hypothetical protein